MSAMPMGAPGWPELAFWTASMDRARMALARSRRVGMKGFSFNKTSRAIVSDAPLASNAA